MGASLIVNWSRRVCEGEKRESVATNRSLGSLRSDKAALKGERADLRTVFGVEEATRRETFASDDVDSLWCHM